MKWKLAVGIVLVIALCVSATFLIPEEEELPTAPVIINDDTSTYETTQVMVGDVQDVRTTYCEYSATVSENLYFEVDGYVIEEIYVQAGDIVEEGQLLAVLNMEDLAEQLTTYENNLAKLELQLEQLLEQKEIVYNSQVAYRNTLSDEELAYTQTASEAVASYVTQQESLEDQIYIEELHVEEVESQISERQIVSPIDGMITSVKSVTEGQTSDKSLKIFEVIDNSSLSFVFTSYYYADILEVGEEVEMYLSEETYIGTTTDVFYVESEEKYYYYITVNDLTASLSDGDKARMELVYFESLDVLYLPSDAICQSKGKDAVYYINEDGIRDVKYVEIGLDAGGYVEIISGVTEGETILVGWD